MRCTPISVQKNACWIWIAVNRPERKFIDFNIGARDTKSGQKLWCQIQTTARETQMIATDYWKPYEHFIPAEKHIQSKAETWTVEGYNSLFRHFLARMRRKSKCYSKSKKMLEHSILLLMAKWNGELSILN